MFVYAVYNMFIEMFNALIVIMRKIYYPCNSKANETIKGKCHRISLAGKIV